MCRILFVCVMVWLNTFSIVVQAKDNCPGPNCPDPIVVR
jgi:hypothetical protein